MLASKNKRKVTVFQHAEMTSLNTWVYFYFDSSLSLCIYTYSHMLSYAFSSHLEPRSVPVYLVVPQMSFTADYLNRHPKENHILLLSVMSLLVLLTKNSPFFNVTGFWRTCPVPVVLGDVLPYGFAWLLLKVLFSLFFCFCELDVLSEVFICLTSLHWWRFRLRYIRRNHLSGTTVNGRIRVMTLGSFHFAVICFPLCLASNVYLVILVLFKCLIPHQPFS